MWTLLKLVQEFSRRQALSVPSAVVGSTDETVTQIQALLNEGNIELTDRFDWACLRRNITFSLTFADDEYLSLNNESAPGCAVKFIVPQTLYNTTLSLRVPGPATDREWADYRDDGNWPTPGIYMVRGNGLWIGTSESGAQAYSLDVALLHSVMSSGGSLLEYPTADTDTYLLPSRVLLADLRWRWRREKGLPYAEDMRSLEEMLRDAFTREGNAQRVDMGRPESAFPTPMILVQPGSWAL